MGARWPLRIFISVDLPAPFSPMIACTSPALTLRETSLRTSIGPNERDRPTASRTGSVERRAPSGPTARAFGRLESDGPCIPPRFGFSEPQVAC